MGIITFFRLSQGSVFVKKNYRNLFLITDNIGLTLRSMSHKNSITELIHLLKNAQNVFSRPHW